MDELLLDKFENLLNLLEKKHEMFFYRYSYSAVVNFIFGFEEAEVLYQHKKVLSNFSSFVTNKLGRECNLHWSAIIYKFLADSDENIALEILQKMLKEYIREQKDK